MKHLALLGALALAGALAVSGCTATGTLTPTAATDVATALTIGCPILGMVQASGLKLNAVEAGAESTLELACPPNPAPTSATVAVADLVGAYTILSPLIK